MMAKVDDNEHKQLQSFNALSQAKLNCIFRVADITDSFQPMML